MINVIALLCEHLSKKLENNFLFANKQNLINSRPTVRVLIPLSTIFQWLLSLQDIYWSRPCVILRNLFVLRVE